MLNQLIPKATSGSEAIKEENPLTITDVTQSEKPTTEKKHVKNSAVPDCIEESKSAEITEEIPSAKPVDAPLQGKPFSIKKSKIKKSKQNLKRQNLCFTCNTNDHSIIPTCVWHQDKNNIYLKFGVLEIEKFNVDCTKKSIMFK